MDDKKPSQNPYDPSRVAADENGSRPKISLIAGIAWLLLATTILFGLGFFGYAMRVQAMRRNAMEQQMRAAEALKALEEDRQEQQLLD